MVEQNSDRYVVHLGVEDGLPRIQIGRLNEQGEIEHIHGFKLDEDWIEDDEDIIKEIAETILVDSKVFHKIRKGI
ncbi:MAG TPA: hypothetical protein ENG50_01790 [Candidatus Altiarchaeales archaeon]|nr:MAG: hypothetical protein DRO65_02890 [Candidatus Altiarchaeales archaeon]HDN83076.1 hypothetical protein [Candidatus Altiarchaeales archaeon]